LPCCSAQAYGVRSPQPGSSETVTLNKSALLNCICRVFFFLFFFRVFFLIVVRKVRYTIIVTALSCHSGRIHSRKQELGMWLSGRAFT
jgi:hypothetical protein